MECFSVATFNVNCDCKAPSNADVASTIADCGADVVCIQESNQMWESFLSRRSDLKRAYPHIQFHSSDWNKWAGFAVISKFPIQTFEVIKETDRGWYPAGLVTLDIPVALHRVRTVHLLVIHLRAPVEFKFPERYWWGGHADWIGGYFSKTVKAKRLHEIRTFFSALQPGLPTIILGDFNERRNSSGCLQYLETMGFANTPKINDSCFGSKNSWKLQLGRCTILSFDYDHIVFSKAHLEPVDGYARIHEDGGSDHCLISASFQFKNV